MSLVSQLTEIEVEISILEISILFEDELQFCDEPSTSESGPIILPSSAYARPLSSGFFYKENGHRGEG